ncbi:DUF6868 family protein [Marinicella litoralis]|uniref:DUF6868 domain-containing protein n=1 Tax=Marinicella litoralis TaxID=644220 RepID=A0A4V3DIU6_9GAMM|nr:hypothetical protein [Marinicella litoralis]TDR23601.1 hypothetical protein C8D91_0465 [Marinicella litoralis]
MNIETIQTFLAWNLLIHAGILLFIVLLLSLGRNWVVKIHLSIFALSKDQLLRVYFNFIAAYKILVMVFVLVPYVVIRFLL